MGVGLSILKILVEIADRLAVGRVFQMIVEPPEQKFFLGEF